jgi:HK97 family phage major capsid protein
MPWEACLEYHTVFYGDTDVAEKVCTGLWAHFVEAVKNNALYVTLDEYLGAIEEVEMSAAHLSASKPPAWVCECISQYRRKGFSEEEAEQRCYGAYYNRRGKTVTWIEAFDAALAETGDAEKAEAAAWGAVQKSRRWVSIKSAKAGSEYEYVVAGWGMLFTDEEDTDLDGEFFTQATETLIEYYDSSPLWYEHREDPAYGDAPIGKRTDWQVFPRGIWVEHGLETDHPQYERTIEEVKAEELSYSSDTAAQIWERVRRGDAVEITQWPLIGWSLTKTPAEPGLGAVSLKEFSKAVKRARQGSGVSAQQSKSEKESDMDELLQQVAEALGVEASVDVVVARLQEIIDELSATTEEGEMAGMSADGKAAVDMPALVKALGLAEDAGLEEITIALQAILDGVWVEQSRIAEEAVAGATAANVGVEAAGMSAGKRRAVTPPADEDEGEEDEEPEQVIADYKALRRAGKSARALLDQDADDPIPGFHRSRPASAAITAASFAGGAAGRRGGAPGKATRRSFQTGLIKRPGLAELVVGTLTGNQSMIKSAAKAVATYSGPAGAYVLNHVTVDDLIDPLYATEVVMAAGAQVERFPGAESVTYPKLNAGAAAYWAAEGVSVKDNRAAFTYLTAYPKRLVAKYLVPNRALRNATVQLEQKLQENLTKSLRLQMDYGFLFGIGAHPGGDHSGKQPLGLVNVEGVNKTALGTNGARPKIKDLMDAMGRVEDANVELGETAAWIFNPRDKRTFTGMTDTTGQPLLRLDGWESKEERDLLGYPWFTSTQVPKAETVGTNDDCSYIIFGEWEEFLVAISQDAELVIDTSRYVEESMTLIQVETHVDCAVFRPEAFDVITGVRAA